MNNEEFNNKIKEAQNLMNNREFTKAKEIANQAIENLIIENSKEGEHTYYFANAIEFLVYVNLNRDINIKWSNLLLNLAYNILGFVGVEENKYKDAIEYLNKAIEANPMDVSSILELAECYRALNRNEEFLNTMDNVYNFVISPEDLARYYRKLGFYYTEIGKYELSYAIYQVSLIFEKSDLAFNEMIYNKQQMNNDQYKLDMIEALNMLKDNNIPVGPKKDIVQILFGLYNDNGLKEKMNVIYNEIKRRLYIFTGDEQFKNTSN